MNFEVRSIIHALIIMFVCFVWAMAWTPALIRLLQRMSMGKTIRDAAKAPVMAQLHAAKAGTPTMGGLVIWVTVTVVMLAIAGACTVSDAFCSWNFLSRGQTLLPLGALVAAALVGLVDDYLNVKRIGPDGGGFRMRHRLISYSLIACLGAWWFYTKLQWDSFHVPFVGDLALGPFYILFFAFVIIATSFSVNETDGLDGLAGGPLMAAFAGYGVIAFSQGKVDLAIFCGAIVGALMAFLWYNVPRASFFMGDTGAMSLGTVLGVVALLTNQPLLLPIIGLPFVIESLSVFAQIFSKKIRHKKLFRSAPLHHHLEAIGWTEPQIVFRCWIVAFFATGVGVIIAFIDGMI